MTDEVHLRIKCLGYAVQAQPFFSMETHKLADKFIHYVNTGEWVYETQPERETEDSGDSNEE